MYIMKCSTVYYFIQNVMDEYAIFTIMEFHFYSLWTCLFSTVFNTMWGWNESPPTLKLRAQRSVNSTRSVQLCITHTHTEDHMLVLFKAVAKYNIDMHNLVIQNPLTWNGQAIFVSDYWDWIVLPYSSNSEMARVGFLWC